MNGYAEETFALSEDLGEEAYGFGEFDEAEAVRPALPRPRLPIARMPYARPRPPATVTGADFQRALEAVRQDVQKLGGAVTTLQRQSSQFSARTRRDFTLVRETAQNGAFIAAAAALLLQPDVKGFDQVLPVVVPPLVPAVMSFMSEPRMTGQAGQSVFRGNLIPIAILGFLVWQRAQQAE
jgi:hypothetical protein